MLHPCPVEPLDAGCGEQVTVGNESGDDAFIANGADDLIEVRVQERLASADGDACAVLPYPTVGGRKEMRGWLGSELRCVRRALALHGVGDGIRTRNVRVHRLDTILYLFGLPCAKRLELR